MIQITFRYIALVSPETDHARVAFPRQKHKLEVFLTRAATGGTTQIAAGRELKFMAKQDGVDQALGLPQPLELGRLGEPIFSIGDCVGGGPYKVLATQDLLVGPAQAVVTLHGGTFRPQGAVEAAEYTDSDWTFSNGAGSKSQKLTDTLVWEITPVAGVRYFLDTGLTGTAAIELFDHDRLLFSNDDTKKKQLSFDATGAVIIPEVKLLYAMVRSAATAATPPDVVPKTTYVPPPQPVPPAGGNAPAPTGAPPAPDMPLCPVGEP